jgi:hypothetical protein
VNTFSFARFCVRACAFLTLRGMYENESMDDSGVARRFDVDHDRCCADNR